VSSSIPQVLMSRQPTAVDSLHEAAHDRGGEPTRVKESFDHDGFAILEGFLAPHELAETLRALESALTSSRSVACERPHNTLVPLRWNDTLVNLLLSSTHRIETLRAHLTGSDLRWISGYVSKKESHSRPLWWHQDWWCWDHPISFRRAASQVAVLCYLTDTTSESGALRVLPRSHRSYSPLHAQLAELNQWSGTAVDVDLEHAAFRDHPLQESLDLRRGDAVLIDYRLLHGTHANLGSNDRHCVLLNFAPGWNDLPDAIRAHLIRQPSLPNNGELSRERPWAQELLPEFDGKPRDLPINRVPPSEWT
jgi:hypothetical protein